MTLSKENYYSDRKREAIIKKDEKYLERQAVYLSIESAIEDVLLLRHNTTSYKLGATRQR